METIGSWLRSVRAQRGASLDQISKATKINLQYLQSLEDDRFDRLPGGMFPRAMVRSYARALQADEDAAVGVYDRQFPPPPPPPEPPPRNWSWLIKSTAVVIITAAATGLIFFRPGWLNRASPPTERITDQIPQRAQEIHPAASVWSGTNADLSAVKSVKKPAEGVNLTLQIVVLDECWLSLSADGSVIDRRLLRKGEAYNYQANNNFEALVGNAGGLKFVINGEVWENLGKSYDVKRIRIDKGEGKVHITS